MDDDRFLLDMYMLKFKNSNVIVDTASGSMMALTKLRAGEVYDIILLDIIMPILDGIELLTLIRKEKLAPTSTIIMLTNQSDNIVKAEELDIDGYIIKANSIPSEVVVQVLDIYNKKIN